MQSVTAWATARPSALVVLALVSALCGMALPGCLVDGDALDPAPSPSDERCNGADDDWDDAVDEGFGVGDACMAQGPGICPTPGIRRCLNGEVACIPSLTPPEPGPEICNGLDDDCDGATDEYLEHEVYAMCGIDDPQVVDAITTTAMLGCYDESCVLACDRGRFDVNDDLDDGCECLPDGADIGPHIGDVPVPVLGGCAIDDDLDNDCDGRFDEHPTEDDFAGGGRLPGVCSVLSYVCEGDIWRHPRIADAPGRLPDFGDEGPFCDGLDNDCDGAADEGIECVACGRADAGDTPCHRCPDGTLLRQGFTCIGGAAFTMGSAEPQHPEIERPVRDVLISPRLLAQLDEVSQREWRALIVEPAHGVDPSMSCVGDRCPVNGVSWFDVAYFANRKSADEGFEPCYTLVDCDGMVGETYACDAVVRRGPACTGYRLPTEAEWEYLARAGGIGPYGSYGGEDATADDLADIAWYVGNTRSISDVEPQPNDWGLVNVLGNVGEWTDDWYAAYPEPEMVPVVDPVGPVDAPPERPRRIWRGGSWTGSTGTCRVSARAYTSPAARDGRIGFRLVRTLHDR